MLNAYPSTNLLEDYTFRLCASGGGGWGTLYFRCSIRKCSIRWMRLVFEVIPYLKLLFRWRSQAPKRMFGSFSCVCTYPVLIVLIIRLEQPGAKRNVALMLLTTSTQTAQMCFKARKTNSMYASVKCSVCLVFLVQTPPEEGAHFGIHIQ